LVGGALAPAQAMRSIGAAIVRDADASAALPG
jgi:hypothetical protein